MNKFTPFYFLFVALSMLTPRHAVAEQIEYRCSVESYCPSVGECIVAPVKTQFSIEGKIDENSLNIGRQILNAQEFSVPLDNVDKGNAYFEIHSAMTPYGSALLFSVSSEGFFITEHGLVGEEPFGILPDPLKLGFEYSPNFRTFTGYCIFPDLEFEGEE